MQELQSENERLLAEFRAERDRRQRTEEQLRVMENRLAESEKLIARQYSSSGQRLSQLSAPSGGSGYSLPASPGFTNSSSGGYGPADPESGLRWQRRASP
ncbi:MAG: hypothetical protein NXI32_20065 [bacterium]|nr:hypothetical protein [bacterium]